MVGKFWKWTLTLIYIYIWYIFTQWWIRHGRLKKKLTLTKSKQNSNGLSTRADLGNLMTFGVVPSFRNHPKTPNWEIACKLSTSPSLSPILKHPTNSPVEKIIVELIWGGSESKQIPFIFYVKSHSLEVLGLATLNLRMIRLSHIPRFSSKFLLGDIVATKCLLRRPRWKEMVAVCLLDSNHPIIPNDKLMQILSIQSNDTKDEPLQKVAGILPFSLDLSWFKVYNSWKWHAMKRKKPGMACLPEPRLPHIDFWVFNSVWPQLFHPAVHFKASGIYSTFTGIHKIRFWKATIFFSQVVK